MPRMIEAGQSRWMLLGLLVTMAFGGCGQNVEGQKPPAPPTAAELSRSIADTREPAYWLGPRFRGISVSHVSAGRGWVGLTYGLWTCDSGCTDSGGVWTGRREIQVLSRFHYADTGIDTTDCWTRVGRVAVLAGCDPHGYPQELLIYAGKREIRVTSLYTRDGQADIPVRAVVRRLRPLNARAQWPLPRPDPLSCHDFGQVHRLYRRDMPQALQPRSAC
jgi:hypothetical protein